MASAPSISFCNARQPLCLPTHDPSNVFSSCGTLEDMVASCTAGATPPFIQGPGISSMVNNRVDEGRGRKRIEPAMEAGICRGGGGGYEGGYNGRQVRGGRGEEGDEMQGGGGIRGDDEEEEEEEEEEEILAYHEKQGGRWSSRVSAGGEEAGEEQGSVTWKKRKLSAEQVRCLERSFEVERKLEGQRKAELASQLRLEPRQIAVWFQNRRARWKSKQLEHDYLALQASFASLQAHFDALLAQKHDLLRQVDALKSKLQQGDDPLKYDVDMGTTFERGIQKENIDQEHEKLALVNIGATRETHGLDVIERVIEQKGDMAKKEKQSDKGRINEVTNKLELSTLSSTEGSVVSEATNSPHAIESSVINSQGPLINPSFIKNDANSSLSSLLPITHLPTQAPPLALGTLDLFNLNNEYIKVEPTEEEDIETQQKYCFILEEHAEGTFPWWN